MSTKPIIVPVIVDDKTGQAFVQINDKLLQMKSRATETMNGLKGDTEKARGSIALLAEDLGVKIPRHLQSLIAESSLAKGALEVAFGGVAVVAFIDVLKQLPEAIDKITGEITGWNDEAKKAYESQVELNEIALKGLEQVQQTLAENKLIGLDGAKRFAQEERNKQEEIQRTTEKLKEQNDEVLRQQKLQQAGKPSITDIFANGFSPSAIAAGYGSYVGAKLTQPEAMKPEQLDKLKQSAQETKNQVDLLKASIDGIKKELAEASKNEFIDGVLQDWKDIKDVQDAVHKRDAAEAAMMKALTPDVKQLSDLLAIPVGALTNSPADKLQQQIIAALKAETAQEKALTDQGKEYGESQFGIEQKLAPLRTKTVQDLKDTVDYYKRLAEASKDPTMIENAKKFEAELDAMKDKAQSLTDVIYSDLRTQGLKTFQDIVTQTKTVGQAFKSMALSIIQDIEKMITEMLFFKLISGAMSFFGAPAAGSLSGAAATTGSAGVTGAFGSGIVPHFASGGDFMAGVPMIVGENGPELMVPSSAGSIIPNGKFGGGNVYNIDARGSQAGVERDIMRAIKASEDRAVVRSVRSIDSRAKRRG